MSTEDPNLSQVTQNMSEVNQDAINQQNKQLNTADDSPAPANGDKKPVDRHGRTFDPSLHEVDAEGKPRINRDGFLAGKPGRPGKSEKMRYGGSPQPEDQTKEAEAKAVIQNQNLARIMTALFIKLGVAGFGEEWYPQKYEIPDMHIKIDEQSEILSAFDQYFRAKGMKDLSPGWALALTLAGYSAARLNQPKTQSKFKIISARVWKFTKNAFSKAGTVINKLIKGVKIAPYADSRNDGERKDNARPEASEGLQDKGNSGSGA
jgi:hypothetical protein